MPYPHLLSDERPRLATTVPAAVPGVRVTCLSRNDRWFFPGSTADAAMILVRAALTEDTLRHPRTEIAFGEKCGGVWVEQAVIKAAEGPAG